MTWDTNLITLDASEPTWDSSSWTAVYPDPEDVRAGVEYGPNGDDFVGTFGGDATLAKQDEMIATLALIKTKTDQLAFTVANQVDANALSGGGTNGTGQYQINITAAVGATAVRNVRVSIEGTDTFAYTGTLGTGTLNVDAGTYTLIVTPPAGYEDVADIDVTVGTADEDVPIELVATTVTVPDDPTLASLIVKCLDETGAAEVGAVVYLQLVGIPTGSTGLAFDGLTQEATSIEGGIATLTIVKLAKYRIRRGGSQQWKEFTAGSGDSQTIVSFIGVDPVVS